MKTSTNQHGPDPHPRHAAVIDAHDRRLAVVPLTDRQAGQVSGGSVEGDAALRAFLDRWFAAQDGARVPMPGLPIYDAAF